MVSQERKPMADSVAGLEQRLSNLNVHMYYLGSSSSAGLGWGLRICVPVQLPGYACAASSLPQVVRSHSDKEERRDFFNISMNDGDMWNAYTNAPPADHSIKRTHGAVTESGVSPGTFLVLETSSWPKLVFSKDL